MGGAKWGRRAAGGGSTAFPGYVHARRGDADTDRTDRAHHAEIRDLA
jgi:hypothetical protein